MLNLKYLWSNKQACREHPLSSLFLVRALRHLSTRKTRKGWKTCVGNFIPLFAFAMAGIQAKMNEKWKLIKLYSKHGMDWLVWWREFHIIRQVRLAMHIWAAEPRGWNEQKRTHLLDDEVHLFVGKSTSDANTENRHGASLGTRNQHICSLELNQTVRNWPVVVWRGCSLRLFSNTMWMWCYRDMGDD